MQTTESVAGPSSQRSRQVLCRWLSMLVAIVIGALAANVNADSIGIGKASGDLDMAVPWSPEVIEAIDAYVPSPSFNGGRLGLDHFAASNSADIAGRVTAPLSNGDIVVAGLINRNTSTGLWNIGLVRYNASGTRVAWANPANGYFGNNYAVYPNSTTPTYQYIRDIKVQNGFIYVLVDVQLQTQTGLGRQNVRIVSFREDGSFHSDWGTFGYPVSGGTDAEDFYGSQMVPISSTQMIVVALTYDSVGPYVSVARLTILGNGAVSLDNGWGSPYGGGSSLNRLIRYYPPSGLCTAPPCNAIPGYATRAVALATADFYVAGSLQYTGTDWDPFVLKISSVDGQVKPEFSATGWRRYGFDQPNSSLEDRAAGLYVYQDEIYLAAQVAQKCHAGIGMAKINGASGALMSSFAGTGKMVFGGQGDAAICFSGSAADMPYAITATGGRIGIVGYGRRQIPGLYNNVDPLLAVVDAVGGAVLDIALHPILRADGSRMGDGVFYSVYGGPNPTSPFTAAGDGRDASAGNTLSYLTGRFIPVSADRIFANGFD